MSDIASAERVSAATVKADFGLFEVCLPEAWVNLARPVPRDRDAEFRARGAVEDLLAEAELVRAAFAPDVLDADLEASPADPPAGGLPTHMGVDCRAVLLHVVEAACTHDQDSAPVAS